MEGSFDLGTLAFWLLAMVATGVVAGLLAGLLGVGGGIVVVPVLFHIMTVLGIDLSVRMHIAVGTSLAIIVPTSIMSARAHYRRGAVDVELLRAWGPWLLLGVGAGALLAGIVPGAALALVFATVALLVALQMSLRPEGFRLRDSLPAGAARALIAGTIGSISTMMGIGGGTLSVPVLSAFGYPIREAVGTAAAIGTIVAVPGALGFLLSGIGVPARPPFSIGYVNLLGVVLIFPATMVLAPYGARIAHAIRPRLLRLAFAFFLVLTALGMLYDVLA